MAEQATERVTRWPKWLYEDRHFGVLRMRRWGSRRPLRVVFETAQISDLEPIYFAAVGRLNFSYGSGEAVSEGHVGMPAGSRCRTWFLANGKAIGVAWEAGAS